MNSSELKGYLTGLILGNGTIDKGVNKRAFEIKSINKEFIYKISKDLTSCTNFEIAIKNIPESYYSGCNHKENWSLRVKAHPYFNKKYNYFYDDYRKRIITKESMSWLTPNGLANWYMSDGYICLVGKESGFIKSRRVDLCTDRYKYKDILTIQNTFINKFKLNSSIIKRGEYYRIRILKSSYNDFIELIYPHIVPSMYYKINLHYISKPFWMNDNVWRIQEEITQCDGLNM